jgi:DNA-binding transcriptional LysR family regulator
MRVKLEQQFFKHQLSPPGDIVETASFLAQLTFVCDQGAAALMAQSVAQHFLDLGLIEVLNIEVSVEVPPVGLITVRDRQPTPITQRLCHMLRQEALLREF